MSSTEHRRACALVHPVYSPSSGEPPASRQLVSGRCFAGNASLLGCCDVIIATADTTLGMGGPAMVEGGGLGVFTPEEIGPMSVQTRNGVVDILVADEAEAVAVAKRYLAYFQGPLKGWTAPDQRRMRHIVPENRLRTYEVRDVIRTLADEGSILELRRDFGRTLVTALDPAGRADGRRDGQRSKAPERRGRFRRIRQGRPVHAALRFL